MKECKILKFDTNAGIISHIEEILNAYLRDGWDIKSYSCEHSGRIIILVRES